MSSAQYPTATLSDVETKRLFLRRFEPADLSALAEVFAKPEVWKFPYGRGFSREETSAFLDGQVTHWQANGFGCWLAIEKATNRTVGYLGLSIPTFLPEILPAVEVGWRLDPIVWGKGYATEGASAAIDHGFDELGLTAICSVRQSGNPASTRVCERLGMCWERTVQIPASEKRGPLAAELYWLKKQEWRAAQSRLPR